MSEFRVVRGFEDVWRPPVTPRRWPESVLKAPTSARELRARLARIVARAPEVMVKVAGRTRDAAHLKAHLKYISRDGGLELETPDGWGLRGAREVRELSAHWSDIALTDSGRRVNTPFSLSLVLSMPRDTDPYVVRDAARAFARQAFGGRFDYVFVLHTDAPQPHVHVAVRALGVCGERLNPKKADLEAWRQTFARELRERGVEAEATPRRARGVTRKRERTAIRRIRARAEAGLGPAGDVQRGWLQAAARAAFGGAAQPTPWEAQLLLRQQRTRALYLGQARLLQASADAADRDLGRRVEAFVWEMPAPDTQRLELARALREANARLRGGTEREIDAKDGGRPRER